MNPEATWREVGPRYRQILYGIGEETATRPGLSRTEVAKVWNAGGKLSLAQLLRCRVRYLSDGLAVGSKSFVENLLRAVRRQSDPTSEVRSPHAAKLKGGAGWGDLRSARKLVVSPISPPDD